MSVAGPPAGPPAARRLARSAVLIAASQGLAALSGAALAVLVAARFGSSARTDGLFAAYGLYSLLVLFAQATRGTIAARLVESSPRFRSFDAYCGAAALVFAACGVVLVVLREPVASILAGSPAAEATAARTLVVLWPAAGGQLFAALAATMLGVLDDHVRPALAYGAGGVALVVGFVALAPVLGIDAVPAAILIATLTTTVPLARGLWRAGWRPPATIVLAVGRNARVARSLVLAQAVILAGHLAYLVSLALAGGLGAGAATVYSYAYFGYGLLLTLLNASASIVLAAPLATTWDRDPASLRLPSLEVLRTGLLALAPTAAAAALVGDDVGRAILGAFSPSEVHATVATFLALVPVVAAAQAMVVPQLALFALGRYGAMALLALVGVALHWVLSLVAAATGGVVALGVATTVSTLVLIGALLALLYGRRTPRVATEFAREVLVVGLVAAVAFGAPAAVLGEAGGAAAFLAGLVLFTSAVGLLLPEHRRLARRLVRGVVRPPEVAG